MNRTERTNAELKKQLSLILLDGIKDPRVTGLISIMKVSCDDDLTLAKVYISVLGADGKENQVVEGLNNAQGYIKSCLKSKIKLRALPQLRFVFDDSIQYGIKISKIIADIKPEAEKTEEEIKPE